MDCKEIPLHVLKAMANLPLSSEDLEEIYDEVFSYEFTDAPKYKYLKHILKKLKRKEK